MCPANAFIYCVCGRENFLQRSFINGENSLQSYSVSRALRGKSLFLAQNPLQSHCLSRTLRGFLWMYPGLLAIIRQCLTDAVTKPGNRATFYEFCSVSPNICRTKTAVKNQIILTGAKPTKSADVQMNLVPPKSPSKAFLCALP